MLDLPSNPTDDELKALQLYLNQQKKEKKKAEYKQDYYKDRKEILGSKLIIFRHKQMKSDRWYMRFYVGDKKYKTLSLRTSDEGVAIEKALENGGNFKTI